MLSRIRRPLDFFVGEVLLFFKLSFCLGKCNIFEFNPFADYARKPLFSPFCPMDSKATPGEPWLTDSPFMPQTFWLRFGSCG